MQLDRFLYKIAEIYGKYHNIDYKYLMKDISEVVKEIPNYYNTVKLLNILEFKNFLLEILPKFLDKWSDRKIKNLSLIVNKYIKHYEVEKILSESGGIYIDEVDLPSPDILITSNGKNIELMDDIDILDWSFNINPITYQRTGSIENIKNGTNIFNVYGKTIEDIELVIRIRVKALKKLFIDYGGCRSVRIVGNKYDIELNDGWNNLDIEDGIYKIRLKPRIVGNVFNIIIRQIIATLNNSELEDKFIYKMNINHYGNFLGIKPISNNISKIKYELLYDDDYETYTETTDSNLSIGNINGNDKSEIDIRNRISTYTDDNQIVGVFYDIDYNENKYPSTNGVIKSNGIIEPPIANIPVLDPKRYKINYVANTAKFSTSFIVNKNESKYLPKMYLPSIHNPSTSYSKLYRFTHDTITEVGSLLDGHINIKTPGYYFISTLVFADYIRSKDFDEWKEELNNLKLLTESISKTGFVLPVYTIEKNIFSKLSYIVTHTLINKFIGVSRKELIYTTSFTDNYSGRLVIETEKPLNGMVLQYG